MGLEAYLVMTKSFPTITSLLLHPPELEAYLVMTMSIPTIASSSFGK
jgi:hypothetical protein